MSEWYRQEGDESDVVLATRGRLSRNLAGYLYPGSMGIDEENEVREKVSDAFLKNGLEDYTYISLGDISPQERRLLFEEKLISQDFCLNKEKHLILSRDRNFSGMINGEDHLRMISFSGGLALEKVSGSLFELDKNLEAKIEFDANFEFGYLGPNLDNLGTGLKISVMLHLPALEATGLIDKALKTVLQAGLQVVGFSGEDNQSLGQFYIMSNRTALGLSEDEIQENLDNMSGQLLTYERMAREDLTKRKMIELEDRVYRGEGLLSHCRLLLRNEGIELTAALRLGRVLDLNGYEMKDLNALLILGQDSHIKERLKARGEKVVPVSVDAERAAFFREYLHGEDTRGGSTSCLRD